MTTMNSAENARTILQTRFQNRLAKGAHQADGVGCALEFWSQVQGHTWTDDPEALQMPDLRSLNDAPWSSEEARAAALLPVLIAVAPVWRGPLARRQTFVERICLDTVREILPYTLRAAGLPEAAARCAASSTLRDAVAMAAEAAAREAWAAARAARATREAWAAADTVLQLACHIWIRAARAAADGDGQAAGHEAHRTGNGELTMDATETGRILPIIHSNVKADDERVYWVRCAGCQTCAFRRDHFFPAPEGDAIHDAARDMLRALETIVIQATKLQGFPSTYGPFSGVFTVARAAISRATDAVGP